MREKNSFVEWLTNRDLEKITSSLNLEIMNEEENANKKRIMRFRDEDGPYIIAFCKDLQLEGDYSQMQSMMRAPKISQIASTMIATSIALGEMGEHSFFEDSSVVVLRFDDFFLQESFSFRSEQEEIEYDQYLTKVYQEYMSQKFGRHYTDMKRAHYQKIYKELREEEDNKEVEPLNY